MEKNEILDTNLLMRGFSGDTTVLNLIEYPKALDKELDILWPTKADYYTAIELMIKLLDIGKPVPAIDVILASVCINRKRTLKTADKHFKHIQTVEPDFKVKFV